MALEAMGISKSEKIVEFLPWPLTDLSPGESLQISARWIRFNAPWLTLKASQSGFERNFSVQGLFNKHGQAYVLLRQARMDAQGREHGFILARLAADSVIVLPEGELTELLAQFSNALETLFSQAEPDRQRGCITGLEKIVGLLTDWNLQEGPSFASFQISTSYELQGRRLKDVDLVTLSQWSLEEDEVFIRLKSTLTDPGEEFQLLWLDRAPSVTFVGVRKPIEQDDPSDQRLVNIFILHETGTFEVADLNEILQGASRAFDAAESGSPLNNREAASVFSSIAGEG